MDVGGEDIRWSVGRLVEVEEMKAFGHLFRGAGSGLEVG